MANSSNVLVGPDCGVSTTAVKGYEKQVEVSQSLFRGRLAQHFAPDSIRQTDKGHHFKDFSALLGELEGCSHYVVSEGLDPGTYQKIKERYPDLHILKVMGINRIPISDSEKISLFEEASRIQEITSFASILEDQPGEMSASEGTVLHLSRHPIKNAQEEALRILYPNAKVVEKPENFPSVEAIVKFLKEYPNLLAIDVVLPAGMVVELLEKKPATVSVIRAQMNNSQRPPVFDHYQWIKETKITMKEFG